MFEIFVSTARKQRGKQLKILTKVERFLQSAVHRTAFKCMKEGGRLVHLTWIACLDEIVRCVVCGKREEEVNENMDIILNMFSKNFFAVLVDLEKKRVWDQNCAVSLRSVHLSISRSTF